MFHFQRTLALTLGLAAISSTVVAGSTARLSRRAQCSTTLDEAQVRLRLPRFTKSSH